VTARQNSKKLTPLQEQYNNIKKKHGDSLLLFRMGDFYETFDEDAVTCSKALGIALAKRQGQDLAGVPYHALGKYLPILIKKGFKVAICEQVEDPKTKSGKIVKREVVRIMTPGTVYENDLLDDKINNYMFSIVVSKNKIGIAIIDFSTGEFLITEFKKENLSEQVLTFMHKFNPAECLLPLKLFDDKKFYAILKQEFPDLFITTLDDYHFEYENAHEKLISHFKTTSLDGFGVAGNKIGIQAAGAIMAYLKNMQKSSLNNIRKLSLYKSSDYMNLDVATQKNLEITQNIMDASIRGSLLEIFDKAVSPMGSRLLRKWLVQPLIDLNMIRLRQDGLEELHDDVFKRQEIREILANIFDIERLISKISYGNANGRDLNTLKNSLLKMRELKKIGPFKSEILKNSLENIKDLPEIIELIEKNIREDCPITIKDGGMIKRGINSDLDELRNIQKNSKDYLLKLEEDERNKTGIKNLKVKFNKVFGYFIEVTKSNMANVPDRYIRKQTLVNAERYIIPELKDFEVKILSSDEKIKNIEYELFVEIRKKVAENIDEIQIIANSVAIFDVVAAFAEIAKLNNYIRPLVNNRSKIEIQDGRHPVVEKILSGQGFIPNDVHLDSDENLVVILTGPNMAGKSTYLRQVALITLLAQIGSFVPAKKATIGVVDRIFSRVGAFDDISRQRSTFMVEMNETANILNNATKRSLIILDELGRGTSTFDGLSIAWSVIEHVHNETRAKTLFATHYHQLCELENYLPAVKNYHITIKEQGNEMIFLRKIKRGGSDKSFGIEVAKMAGIPDPVIERAQKILKKLESGDPVQHPTVKKYPVQKIQKNDKVMKPKEKSSKKVVQKSLFD